MVFARRGRGTGIWRTSMLPDVHGRWNRLSSMKLPLVALILIGVAILLALSAPFALLPELRRSADTELPGWWGTAIGRRQRWPFVICLLTAVLCLLAATARLTSK